MTTDKMTTDKLIDELCELDLTYMVRRRVEVAHVLLSHKDKMDEFLVNHPNALVWVNEYGSIRIDQPTREQLMQWLQIFPGTWFKKPSDVEGKLDYTIKVSETVTVEATSSEPPPSCKIVEVEEEIPAQPATRRKVFKVICSEPTPIEDGSERPAELSEEAERAENEAIGGLRKEDESA